MFKLRLPSYDINADHITYISWGPTPDSPVNIHFAQDPSLELHGEDAKALRYKLRRTGTGSAEEMQDETAAIVQEFTPTTGDTRPVSRRPGWDRTPED